SAYQFLGLRQIGAESLRKAAAILERAIAEFSASSSSRTWWSIQYGYGVVQFYIGSHTQDVACLDQAKMTFEYLLEHYSKERSVGRWAATTSSLANVYSALGRRTGSVEALMKAVSCYRAAMDAVSPEDVSHWALVRENLGRALSALGQKASSL